MVWSAQAHKHGPGQIGEKTTPKIFDAYFELQEVIWHITTRSIFFFMNWPKPLVDISKSRQKIDIFVQIQNDSIHPCEIARIQDGGRVVQTNTSVPHRPTAFGRPTACPSSSTFSTKRLTTKTRACLTRQPNMPLESGILRLGSCLILASWQTCRAK